MVTKEFLLILLPFLLAIGLPTYIILREIMVRKIRKTGDYSRRRVFKLTIVNMLINIGMFIYFAKLFFTITEYATPGNTLWAVYALFLIIAIAFYGSGMYLCAIVIENYTVLELRKKDPFKKQFIATHLFHGPISHILIYSSWILALMFLAIIDSVVSQTLYSGFRILMVAAAFSGFTYAIAQIYNGTSPYQLLTGVISLIFYLAFINYKNIYLSETSVGGFFLVFDTIFILTIYAYFLFLSFEGKKIDPDRSGWERVKDLEKLKKQLQKV